MSNLSSLLMGDISLKSKTQGNEENEKNGEEYFGKRNDVANAPSENVKIKVVNMQEYKTKKYLEERKNVKVWNSPNKGQSKKGKKEKKGKPEEEKEKNEKTNGKNTDKIENTNAQKTPEAKTERLYRPPIRTILAQEQNQKKKDNNNDEKEEELYPDLMKAKNVSKAEKEKGKIQAPKKNKKDKKKKQTENDAEKDKGKEIKEQNNIEEVEIEGVETIKEIEKISFNIFDIIDMEVHYDPISRNIEKVAQKYESREKYKEMIECN